MAAKRRSVFTGLGLLSSIGCDPTSYWTALTERRCGIRNLPITEGSGLHCRMAGDIPAFDPRTYLKDKEQRKSIKMMARTVQLGVSASQLAYDHSKLTRSSIDPTRFGVEFGSGMIATDLDDIAPASRASTNCAPGAVSLAVWGNSLEKIPPIWMLKYLPNMPACHASISFDAQGPNNTITESDVASLLALGEARRIIERDKADGFIVGGAESKLNALSLVRHNLFQSLSRRNDSPQSALRPFDLHRDGTVLAEAATVFILEELDHARNRGAEILAEVVGFASGFDRARDGKILAKVIRKAIAEAGISASDIDHINAFSLGTVKSDIQEAAAIREVFGGLSVVVPVWCPKANVGSTGAASSLLELAASVLALRHGFLPPTINCDTIDPSCGLPVHTHGMRPIRTPYALKISFTDLGQCGVAVIRTVD